MGGTNSIGLTQYRENCQASCKCGNELPGFIIFKEFLDYLSRRISLHGLIPLKKGHKIQM
jgi:hypothetical protein